MRRGIIGLLFIVALVLLSGTGLAQQDARSIILRAYQNYEAWQTFQVTVSDSSDYAMTAQGAQTSVWQKREQDMTLSGWYDLTNRGSSVIALDVTNKASTSTDTGTRQRWTVDLNAALVNGETFWRGTYSTTPADSFTLPTDWTTFGSADTRSVPVIADLLLNRYLLQDNTDPFIGDYQAWLDAAISIDGPLTRSIDRGQTQGDLYTIEVSLADAPELLENRFRALTDSANPIITNRAAFLNLLENQETFIWEVLIDPATTQIIEQTIQIAISAEIDGSTLNTSYSLLKLEFTDDLRTRFSAINAPLTFTDLPLTP